MAKREFLGPFIDRLGREPRHGALGTRVTLEDQARAALKRGDLPAAVAAARALTIASPLDPMGFFLLGMAAAEAGQVSKAIPLVEAAVERGPQPEHLAQLSKLLILLYSSQHKDASKIVVACAFL